MIFKFGYEYGAIALQNAFLQISSNLCSFETIGKFRATELMERTLALDNLCKIETVTLTKHH